MADPYERKMRSEVTDLEIIMGDGRVLNRHPHSVHFAEIGRADKESL